MDKSFDLPFVLRDLFDKLLQWRHAHTDFSRRFSFGKGKKEKNSHAKERKKSPKSFHLEKNLSKERDFLQEENP